MESGEPQIPVYEVTENLDDQLRVVMELAIDIEDAINQTTGSEDDKAIRAHELVSQLNEQAHQYLYGQEVQVTGTYYLAASDYDQAGDSENYVEEYGEKQGDLTDFVCMTTQTTNGDIIWEVGNRVMIGSHYYNTDVFHDIEVQDFLFAPVKKTVIVPLETAFEQQEIALHDQLPEDDITEEFTDALDSLDQYSQLTELGQIFDRLRLRGVTEKQLDAYMSLAEYAFGLKELRMTVEPRYYVEQRLNVAIPVQISGPIIGVVLGLSLAQHFEEAGDRLKSIPYKDVALALKVDVLDDMKLLHVPLTALKSYSLG